MYEVRNVKQGVTSRRSKTKYVTTQMAILNAFDRFDNTSDYKKLVRFAAHRGANMGIIPMSDEDSEEDSTAC